MDDQLIWTQAKAAEIACKRMSSPGRSALHESLEEACRRPTDSGWDQKVAAHAAFFTVLAESAGDPVVASVLLSGRGLARDLMMTAGRACDWIVINSRRRFLECLRAGDTEGAALELQEHLRILHVMCRLTGRWGGGRGDRPARDRDLIASADS